MHKLELHEEVAKVSARIVGDGTDVPFSPRGRQKRVASQGRHSIGGGGGGGDDEERRSFFTRSSFDSRLSSISAAEEEGEEEEEEEENQDAA